MGLEDFRDEDIAALEQTRAPEAAKAFDSELKSSWACGAPRTSSGLVIRNAYLWAEEHRRGQEEGVKDRPCAVVLIATHAQSM